MAEPDIATPVSGPACALCGEAAVVHWQRRLTPTEIEVEQAIEQGRRDAALLLADPDRPPPDFGPLPDCLDFTRLVHACYNHAIHGDTAALIHQASCTAPAAGDLPGCNCTPETAPAPQPDPEPVALPPGW